MRTERCKTSLWSEGPAVNSHGREVVVEAQEDVKSAEGAALIAY
jgi:hypothetical protein